MEFLRISLLLALAAFAPSALAQTSWWEDTVVYQIYPRSFQDSDGDGVGDIQGIISRLDYLQDLGVETVWISPMYKSPMKDFGYDISDFRDIDPIFGDLDDFDELVEDMHSRGMNLVMDFIPNHSSDQHEWFNASVRGEAPYDDYYVWRDPSGFDQDGNPIPPNNWLSVFRFSAWEYNDQRQQFYLHQFVVEQPDLNYRNEAVRREMNDVLLYWLDLGVDGFRFDAVLHVYEDEQFRDEPESGDPNAVDEFDYLYLDHIYTYDLPETKEVALAEMYQTIKDYAAEVADDGEGRVDMLESYAGPEDSAELYLYSDFPFNMLFIEEDNVETEATADEIETIINRVIDNVPEGKVANWVLGNHDRWRVGSRFGAELVDVFNVLTMTLPGVAVTYQGEEIGMLNNMDITYEETVDPAGCNCGPDLYNDQDCSRDPERAPMQWTGDQPNAGFTDPDAVPWLPVNDNYVDLNVEDQQADPRSHLAIYKALVDLRKTVPVYKTGSTLTATEGEALGFFRYEDSLGFATVVNLSKTEEQSIDLLSVAEQAGLPWKEGISVIDTVDEAGFLFGLDDITLAPAQAIVLNLVVA